jgi:hypothetical protein
VEAGNTELAVSVSPTATTATVMWTTNVSARSRVDFPLVTRSGYLEPPGDGTCEADFQITVANRASHEQYHFEITSAKRIYQYLSGRSVPPGFGSAPLS